MKLLRVDTRVIARGLSRDILIISHLFFTNKKLSFVITSTAGAVVRALASHQCGPGSISRLGVTCALSLVVVYSAPREFSLGDFSSPQKPTYDFI